MGWLMYRGVRVKAISSDAQRGSSPQNSWTFNALLKPSTLLRSWYFLPLELTDISGSAVIRVVEVFLVLTLLLSFFSYLFSFL